MARQRRHPARGLASGLTAPSIVTERTIAQLERMLAIPIEEAIIPASVQGASDADRERIREVVRDVVYPADAAFLEALRGEYRHASREEPGLWSAPERRARSTGPRSAAGRRSSWIPREIHEIGLDELAAIDAERREIARAAGFGDDTAAYRASLDDDPGNTPATKDELVARAREDIERAMAAAPRYFGGLPRAGLRGPAGRGVQGEGRAVRLLLPADRRRRRATASTTPTATTCRRASTRSSPRRPTTRRPRATTSRSRSRWRTRDLNTFRRLGARMVGGAYVEGWGLYSERLADEMGLYRTEAERFGMLDAQAWRAARLVVDTGMHALRWERQRSIDFLRNDAGLSETDAVIETDRYICWPGQALTYKLGQRADRAAAPRDRGPRRLGASTCASSTTRSSATARCRWRRSPASCRPGSPRRPDPRPFLGAQDLRGARVIVCRGGGASGH